MHFFKSLLITILVLGTILSISGPLLAMNDMRTVYLISRREHFITKFINDSITALEEAKKLIETQPERGFERSKELMSNFCNEVFEFSRFGKIQSAILALLQELVKQEEIKKDVAFCSFVVDMAYKLRKGCCSDIKAGVEILLQDLQERQEICAICSGEFAYGQDYGKGQNKYEDGDSILPVGASYFNCTHPFHKDCFEKECLQKLLLGPIIRCPVCRRIIKIDFCPALSQRTAKIRKANSGRVLDLSGLNLEFDDVCSILGEIDLAKRANITELYLSTNNLKQLKPGIFDGLTNLKELALSENKLNQVDPAVFNKLPKLQKIYLYGNPLTQQAQDILKSNFAGKIRFK